MKVDSKGNIYVAQWFGGKILKISPDGKLLHVLEIAAGDGTTNVAFSEGEKELYVTVVKDPKDAQAKGSIVKIANVKKWTLFDEEFRHYVENDLMKRTPHPDPKA